MARFMGDPAFHDLGIGGDRFDLGSSHYDEALY
jgi:hypothetical protein